MKKSKIDIRKKSNILTKMIFMIIVVAVLIFWKNPPVGLQTTLTIHDSIYQNNFKTIALESMGREFTVNYIENSCLDAINPCFPAIHISTAAAHNAWVHLIYTDSVYPHQRLFIDAGSDDFPFYTQDLDFYDAPYWNYTLLKKPLSFWRGHAYAVQLDDNQKIIGCVGGISWGFKLSFFRTNPKMIAPNVLSTDNWQQDLKLIERLIKAKEDA